MHLNMKLTACAFAIVHLAAAADWPPPLEAPASVPAWNKILEGKSIHKSAVSKVDLYDPVPGQIDGCSGQSNVWAMTFDDGPVSQLSTESVSLPCRQVLTRTRS